MTDNMSAHDIARAWVTSLEARGVVLVARGKQLVMTPKSAYTAMSNDERATLKLHKGTILELLRTRLSEALVPTVGPPTVAPTPEPCPYCYRAPCIGKSHESFLALHPTEARRYAADLATQEMLRPGSRLLPDWYHR